MPTFAKKILMKESEDNFKDLANILKNGDDNLIIEAIESLRNEESFGGAVQLLSELYDDTLNGEIKKHVEKFFNDIKSDSLRKEIAEVIKQPLKPGTLKMVVSSCWQSGLDFSDFPEDFAELFVKSDYETALECMTVIEEMSAKLNTEQRKKISIIIGKTENKNTISLANELLDTLKE